MINSTAVTKRHIFHFFASIYLQGLYMNEIVTVLINYGIAGVVIFMFYQLIQTILQKHLSELSTKINELSNHITTLTKEIQSLREELRLLRERVRCEQ
jgi:hypothetical protein